MTKISLISFSQTLKLKKAEPIRIGSAFFYNLSRPEIALQQKSNEYERKRKTVR